MLLDTRVLVYVQCVYLLTYVHTQYIQYMYCTYTHMYMCVHMYVYCTLNIPRYICNTVVVSCCSTPSQDTTNLYFRVVNVTRFILHTYVHSPIQHITYVCICKEMCLLISCLVLMQLILTMKSVW